MNKRGCYRFGLKTDKNKRKLYPCYKNRLFLELNLRFTQNEGLYRYIVLFKFLFSSIHLLHLLRINAAVFKRRNAEKLLKCL